MINSFLQQLPALMKEQEPDLAKVLNPALAQAGVMVNKPAIVKLLNIKLDTTYQQGIGLASLMGQVNISLKDSVTITVKGDMTINLIVDKNILLTVSKDGLTKIEGIKVDGPGFLDPAVTSAIIKDNLLHVKVGPVTQKIPLPKVN